MKFKKEILAVILIFLIVISVGCSQNQQDENVEAGMFDMKQGMKVSKGYLTNIINGNIEIANSLCAPELINSNKELTTGISSITSFSVDSTIEGNNFGYFLFNVIRSSTIESKSDLENFVIKVVKTNDNYAISEVKAKSQKELYVKENGLRIIGDEGGKSSLVLSLNNIPKDTYLRENKLMLFKDKVPNESFGKVALSFTGKRIAITTTNNKDSFVCIAFIDEALMTTADVSENGSEAATSSGIDQLQQALEKSIAKKIVSIDLFKNGIITNFLFSKEENILAIEFLDELKTNRTNLYNTDDGSIIDTKINEIFPTNKYNISNGVFDEENFKFKVAAIEGEPDINSELIGEYSLDLTSLEIKKL